MSSLGLVFLVVIITLLHLDHALIELTLLCIEDSDLVSPLLRLPNVLAESHRLYNLFRSMIVVQHLEMLICDPIQIISTVGYLLE